MEYIKEQISETKQGIKEQVTKTLKNLEKNLKHSEWELEQNKKSFENVRLKFATDNEKDGKINFYSEDKDFVKKIQKLYIEELEKDIAKKREIINNFKEICKYL